MKSALINRIIILLGAIGIFVAGVLSAQHLFGLEIPCTVGGGCEVVARHPSSYLPIQIGPMNGIPVAFAGFLGYALITVLAIFRAATGKYNSAKWVGVGFFLSAVGMLFSMYLQYVSFTEIHAKCIWCMSSAVLMTAVFFAHVLLLNESNKGPVETQESLRSDIILGSVGICLALVATGITMSTQKKANIKIEVVKVDDIALLIPEKRNQLGVDTAAVTIVEFADLCCPACRVSIKKIKEVRQKYGDKIRIIYRHFPLDQLKGHEMSLIASVTAEVAADQGKFWQFAESFTSTPEAAKTKEEVFQLAKFAGVDTAKVEQALNDENSPAQQRLFRDAEAAIGTFKLTGTPQYLLYIKGEPVRKLNGEALMAELDSPDVQKYLK